MTGAVHHRILSGVARPLQASIAVGIGNFVPFRHDRGGTSHWAGISFSASVGVTKKIN